MMSKDNVTNVTSKEGVAPQSIKDILSPLIAIIVGLFMVILDGTAVNVALPKLVETFNSSLSVLQWTVTGYALAQAAVIPLAGWLSDRFGAKKVFLISLVLFTLGSVLCALAVDPGQLILFRVLQGLGGGLVMPIAMAFTYRLSPPNMVGAVMGMMGIPILLAPALGPIVAGWLVDFAAWQWIFLINIPVGIIGLVIGVRSLPSIAPQSVAALDKLGMILGPLAFAALSYGVSEGGNDWTSAKTLTGIIVGVIALILFIIVELRQENPMLELRVFKSMDFVRGIVIQWVTQIGLFGTMFLVPLFLQQAKGYSAFDTGLIMLPQALCAGLFMPISGKLYDKVGARPLVMIGMAITTGAAYLLSTVDAGTSVSTLLVPLAMLGAGMGLAMMPLNTHLIMAAPQNLVGRVTSLTGAAQQVINSFAIAGLTTILIHHMKTQLTAGVTEMGTVWSTSFGKTFIVVMSIAVGGLLISALLNRPKQSAELDDQAKAEAASMMVG